MTNGPEPKDTAKEIFADALDLEGAAREAFLDERCADDRVLREELESLLAAGAGAPHFLAESEAVAGERSGSVIGRYELVKTIGQGGFGTVWMANQLEPVRRAVALKIIRLGMDSRQVVARFEAERQALALMDHPNIAKVLDGGMTESGRPFFVMELVRGVPITEYCDSARLPVRERLALFLEVCSAVHHAHQKGIIHRDLKPSNVLVSLRDESPMPVVIDFGIAKATHQSLIAEPAVTEHRQFLGTPEYMSPEQTGSSGHDVDTRTDIYSLGVLLYELLTGTTPADSPTIRRASYDELLRLIREVEPPRPSARIAGLGDDAVTVSRARATESGALERQLRGDLDWIVMKALEKERTRRYESAASFSLDIQRHLSREPVIARPPSRAYRARKFVSRNRLAVGAAAVVTVAVLLGTVLSTIGFLRAERGRRLAAEEAAMAESINTFYDEMLLTIDPLRLGQRSAFARRGSSAAATAPGLHRDVSVVEMLLRAADSIDERFAGKPQLEVRVRETIGVTLLGLSRVEEARDQLDLAAALGDSVVGGCSEADRLRIDLLRADACMHAGDLQPAIRLGRRALEGMRRVHGSESAVALHAASTFGEILSEAGEFARAQVLLQDTLAAQRRVLGGEHRDTIDTLNRLAVLFLWQTKPLEAEPYAREAYELSAGLDPDDIVRVDATRSYGMTLEIELQHDQAEPILRSALEMGRRILGDDHQKVAITLQHLSRCLEGDGDPQERERLLREAIAIVDARGDAAANSDVMRRDLAMLLFELGRPEEALVVAREALAVARKGDDPGSRQVHRATDFLRLSLLRTDREEEARRLAVQQVELLRQRGDDPDSLWTCSALGAMCRFLRGCGMIEEACSAWEGCLRIRRTMAEREGATGDDLVGYAQLLLVPDPRGQRDVDAAILQLERGLELGVTSEWKAMALVNLESAYRSAGRADDADAVQAERARFLERVVNGGGAGFFDLYSYGNLILERPTLDEEDLAEACRAFRLAGGEEFAVNDPTGMAIGRLAATSLAAGDDESARDAYARLAELRAERASGTAPGDRDLLRHLRSLVIHPFPELRPESVLRPLTERVTADDADSLTLVSLAWWRLGDPARARAVVDEAIRVRGEATELERIVLAACLGAAGSIEDARGLLQETERSLAASDLDFAIGAELASLVREVRTALELHDG